MNSLPCRPLEVGAKQATLPLFESPLARPPAQIVPPAIQNLAPPRPVRPAQRIYLDRPRLGVKPDCETYLLQGWPMNRKSFIFTLAIAAALAAGLAPPPAGAQNPPPRRPRIAVLDFDYATVRTYTDSLFGTEVDVGKGITDLLVTDLVKDGTFSIIERKRSEEHTSELQSLRH